MPTDLSVRVALPLKVARLISDILNPAAVSAPVFAVLSWHTAESLPDRVEAAAVSVFFSSVIPSVYVGYLRVKGIITDVYIPDRSQRTSPLVVGTTSYLIGLLILLLLRAPRTVSGLMLSYAANTMVLLFVTRRWKISIHTMGVSGPVAALLMIYGAEALPFFALLLAICWARMKLGVHALPEVVAGGLVGLTLTPLLLSLFI